MLLPGESRCVCQRNRQTDGRQTVTLRFTLDAASVIKVMCDPLVIAVGTNMFQVLVTSSTLQSRKCRLIWEMVIGAS